MSGSSDCSTSYNSIKRKGIGKMNTPNKQKDKGEVEGEGGRGGDRVDTAPLRNGSGEKRSPQTEGEGYSGKHGRGSEWEGRGRRNESGLFSFSAAKVKFLLYSSVYVSTTCYFTILFLYSYLNSHFPRKTNCYFVSYFWIFFHFISLYLNVYCLSESGCESHDISDRPSLRPLRCCVHKHHLPTLTGRYVCIYVCIYVCMHVCMYPYTYFLFYLDLLCTALLYSALFCSVFRDVMWSVWCHDVMSHIILLNLIVKCHVMSSLVTPSSYPHPLTLPSPYPTLPSTPLPHPSPNRVTHRARTSV